MGEKTDKKNLLLMMDRPTEPVFVAKGDRQAVFEVPNDYLVKPKYPTSKIIFFIFISMFIYY